MKVFLRRNVAGLGDKDGLIDVDAARGRKLVKAGWADRAVVVGEGAEIDPLPAPPVADALKPELEAYVADNGVEVEADKPTLKQLREAIDKAVEARGVEDPALTE